ncbi:MAG: PD40 domain-containing protein [bacterium]|nr:PD40 domain-containing protein [bacterium]
MHDDLPRAPNDDDVYISERIDDSTWTTPVNAGPNVNNEGRNLSPSITSDRQRLYFVSYHEGSYDIFVSHQNGPDWDDWSPKEQLPEPINRGREFTGRYPLMIQPLSLLQQDSPACMIGERGLHEPLTAGWLMVRTRRNRVSLDDPSGFVSPCLTMNERSFCIWSTMGT